MQTCLGMIPAIRVVEIGNGLEEESATTMPEVDRLRLPNAVLDKIPIP
jgi:hypothetical protein